MLTTAFAVKNIKDGAQPLPELMDTIKTQLLPSRKTATEKIQQTFSKTKAAVRAEAKRKAAEEDMRRAHAEAERIAAKTATGLHQFGADLDPDEALDQFIQQREEFKNEEAAAAIRNRANPNRLLSMKLSGEEANSSIPCTSAAVQFLNTTWITNSLTESMNSSPSSRQEDADPMLIATELKVLIDLLIVSYSRAEANFADDTMLKAGDFIEQIRNYWGQFSRVISTPETWNNPRVDAL